MSVPSYAVLTWEIKLFQNYFSLRRLLTKIILFQCVETCLKLFQNYFRSLLQLADIFQHVQCRWNNFSSWNNFISVSDVGTCKIKHWNNFEFISVFYFTHNHLRWLHVKKSVIISKLFQNNFIHNHRLKQLTNKLLESKPGHVHCSQIPVNMATHTAVRYL